MTVQTVLLIEDDDEDARLVRDSLTDAPDVAYRVLRVENLSDGLERLSGGGVDLVFLDLSISSQDGLVSLAKIHSQEPDLPVVVLSSHHDEALAMQAVAEGAQDYLVKSWINESVIVRVARYAIERNRILRRLRQLDQLRSQFISTVSHEMRTPLTIVREFVALVRDGVPGAVNAEQVDCLDSALRNCDRLTSLIDDLLDLSRIESGKVKLRRVKTDLDALLRQCHEDFQQKAQHKDQQLELELPDTLPAVLCDADKVLQVVVNLLNNAHKFTAASGTITLRAGTENGTVRIEVQDDGIGISKEDQSRIFEAFTQIERKDGPGAQGTGLGLTISKHIVEMHGGALTLDSVPGRGSRFAFTLPWYDDGAELHAFLVDRLRIYRARKKVAAVVLLRVADGADVGDGRLEQLQRIQRCAEETLRSRRDEMLLVESEELLICLLEGDTAGSAVALRRLGNRLDAAGIDVDGVEYALTEVTPSEAESFTLERAFSSLGALTRPPRRKRILVVDDDRTIVALVRSVLEASGLDVDLLLTTSGYEACIRFGGYEPDLVVLDIHMPDIDGREVLTSMRNASTKPTRFLVLSGHPERFAQMRDLGCDDCMSKPFDVQAFADTVATLLQIDRHADAIRA